MPTLDVITVVTTDLERSLAFYRLLGVGSPDLVAPRFTLARPGPSGSGSPGPPNLSRRPTTSTTCASASAVRTPTNSCCDTARRPMPAIGRSHLPMTQRGEPRCAGLDPDGNVVELYSPLP